MKKRKFLAWARLPMLGMVFAISCGTLLLLFATAAKAAERQLLNGHVPTAVTQLNLQPVGRLPSTNRLHLAVGLPLRNKEALNTLLQQLYDPASPQYHRYLTPEQFTERFGPTEQDYQAVINFAKTNGLEIVATSGNRVLVDVSAKVSDIERAFHVTLRTYQHPTEARQFFAPDVEPSVDASVPILHVSGLDNYAIPRPAVHRSHLAENAAPGSGSAPGGYYRGYDFRNAYVPNVTLNGANQMVGLLEFDGYYTNDIISYENQCGLSNVPLQNVLLDGVSGVPSSDTDDVAEVSLDIEMVVSMAPGLAGVVVFEGENWNDILNSMASNSQIKQLSSSWGYWGSAPDLTADQIFQQMMAQGQSFFQASGDADAWCASTSIWWPGDDPYLTSVGGTALTMNGSGASYASETVWNLGYDGSGWNGLNGGYVGSGGGVSTNYSIPTWQQSVNLPAVGGSTSMRNIPDVALVAYNMWIVYFNGLSSGGWWGTSFAAPLWAGYTALVNQQGAANSQPSVGFLNPAIYTIGTGPNYAACFHDITSGNNTNPCSGNAYLAAPGYDLCTGWGTANGQNLINVFFGTLGQLGVSPGTGLTSSGSLGGPFSPGSQIYALTNSGGATLSWTASETVNWLTLSATSGTLAPGIGANVTVSINADANSLVAGSYADTVSFTNATNGAGNTTRAVSLTITSVVGEVTVSPSSGFVSGGPPGGPFNPISQTYTLSNVGQAALNWTATNGTTWLTLSATSGTLAAGATTNVTAAINANANNLAPGGHTDTIGFTNTTSGLGNTTSAVSLSIGVGNFGFYNDFSTFASGNLVGQQGWTQVSTYTGSPLQISGGQAGFTGGLTANDQTAYKGFTLTNETVFYGLTLTVTNAPNTNAVPYFAALYNTTNGTGTSFYRLAAESPDPAKTNYVLGVRISLSGSDPYTFGTTGLSYGTQYRVIVEAAGTSVILYVNPTSGTLGAQTPYTQNSYSSGASVGSFVISQLDNGSIPSAGGTIGKVVVDDNFGTVYTDLVGVLPPTASFSAIPTNGAAPLSVSFTDQSSGPPTSWSWTFGDGGTSTVESPTYVYASPGTYTATLVASNAGGASTNTATATISVYDPFTQWQQFYGLSNNCALCGPNASYTGDGMSNTNKFMAGFSPINAAAYLHIISIAEQLVAGNTNVVVTYLGANGDNSYVPGIASRTNVLDFMTGTANGSYATGGWQDTGLTNILSGGNGSGTITSMTDSNITASPDRYYRVRVLLP
ncbi:MAG: protease pro-enzyme activation domain-containing protein [Verrucomicrobiia bacterium]